MQTLKIIFSSRICVNFLRKSLKPSNFLQCATFTRRAQPKLPQRTVPAPQQTTETNLETNYPRKIFSGIQPTGALHLGNYLGAIKKWVQMQNSAEDVTFCIVDMHSITTPQTPAILRENIFQMAATLLACGIDPEKSTIFVQSAVREHAELSWILSCHSTMARLSHLPQFKEKSRQDKELPLGLFLYPILQAADIMLYKATHVPVGDDQLQHVQLAQHLAKTFNTKYGQTFPICHSVIENKTASRIRSLRDPAKKMSKSDLDPKASIFLTDEPDVIVQKIKKAITDFRSDITYDMQTRAGVSNLIAIHHLVTGESIDDIILQAKTIDTGMYKLRVADAVVEHLKPLRSKIEGLITRRSDLIYLLEVGADKARQQARQTMSDVRLKVGLGAIAHVFPEVKEEVKTAQIANEAEKKSMKPAGMFEIPEVPKQGLRVEKRIKMNKDVKTEKIEIAAPMMRSVMDSQSLTSTTKSSNTTSTNNANDSNTNLDKINEIKI